MPSVGNSNELGKAVEEPRKITLAMHNHRFFAATASLRLIPYPFSWPSRPILFHNFFLGQDEIYKYLSQKIQLTVKTTA